MTKTALQVTRWAASLIGPSKRLLWAAVLATLAACGPDVKKEKDPSKLPGYFAIIPRLASGLGDEPSVIESVALDVTGCTASKERSETIRPGSNGKSYLKFAVADSNCIFEIKSVTLASEQDGTPVVFVPEQVALVDGSAKSLTIRMTAENNSSPLFAQFLTDYSGSFSQTAQLVMLFGFESIARGLGLEQRRIDNQASDEESDGIGNITNNFGVGLRIESMILKRSPDGSGIIAIEPRLGCYAIRESNLCLGRRLEDFEFMLIPDQKTPPSTSQLNGAFQDPSKITKVNAENIFGNGLYALVSTPELLPANNIPITKLWLLARHGTLISAFEISTEGMSVF